MASRYYPTKHYPSVRVTASHQGTWGDISGVRPYINGLVFRIKTSKTDGGRLLEDVHTCNRESDYDYAFVQMMTPPLTAQAITGTFDLLFRVRAEWFPAITNESQVRYKVHVYISKGETGDVRETLLNNYVDTVDWPEPATASTFQGLASAQALAAQSTLDGDTIVIEVGARILSAPTPGPAYPLVNFTTMRFLGFGTTNSSNVAFADAVAGDTSASRSGWMEFSMTLVEKAPPAAPANGTCATALVIATVPHRSDFVNSTTSTDPGPGGGGRAVWWEYTAERTGLLFVATYGSNYPTNIFFTEAVCGGSVVGPLSGYQRQAFAPGGNAMSSAGFDVTVGVTYLISAEHFPGSGNSFGVDAGGSCRIVVFYREQPVIDDLYLVAGDIVALREVSPGTMMPVNLSSSLQSLAPSGVAIDYSRTPMVPISGDNANPHINERLFVSLFGSNLVEILDIFTLSWAPSINEIDFHSNALAGSDAPAQLYITDADFMWQANFGDGFLLAAGVGGLTTALDSVSDTSALSAIRGIRATQADNQPGPQILTALDTPFPDIEHCAPWTVTLDEANNILFYTSGGFYSPQTGDHPTRDSIIAIQIKRYNLTTQVQLTDFATVTAQAGENPGLKGLQFLPLDGGLLACNSTQVIRFDASGAIVTTYIPSIPLDSQSLCDIVLTADQRAFWVLDEATIRIFKFSLVTGLELTTYDPRLLPGTTIQMQIYKPGGPLQLLPCPPEFVTPPLPDVPPGPPTAPPADARTLIFELPKRRWFYDQYDKEAIRTRLSDPGDDVYAQILGGTAGNLYQYDATALRDDDTDLTYRMWTPWPDADDPRGEKIASDLVLDIDPAGSINGIIAGPVVNNAQRILTPITVGATLTGRQQLSLNPVSGQGLIARNLGLRIEGTLSGSDTARPTFYEWIFAWVPNWVNAGTTKAKFFQGLVIHADTGGADSSFRVDSGDGIPQEVFPIPATDGEVGIAYSFARPFEAHLVRLVPLGSWRILRVEWVWEPTAEFAYHWQTQPTTHDLPGYLTVRDGMIAYAASFPVTWTISYTDGGSTEYTLPATGGAYTRLYIPCVARKGTAVTYDFVSVCPFQLFQRDCSVRIQGWGQPGGLQTMTPFGGLSRERGARI